MKSLGKNNKSKTKIFVVSCVLTVIIVVAFVFYCCLKPRYISDFSNWADFISGYSGLSYPNEVVVLNGNSDMLAYKSKGIYVNGYISRSLPSGIMQEAKTYYYNEYKNFNDMCLQDEHFKGIKTLAYDLPKSELYDLMNEHSISDDYIGKLLVNDDVDEYSILLYDYYENSLEDVFNIILYNDSTNSIIHIASNVRKKGIGNW